MVDDARPLPPWVRLVVQVGGRERCWLRGASGWSRSARSAPPGLVLATVACCNAVNMVDGQDGLAAGLGAIAALGLAAVLDREASRPPSPWRWRGRWLGFLVWNRPTARIFLGDGGAYAVGVLLAASAAQATSARVARPARGGGVPRRVRLRARVDDRSASRIVRAHGPRGSRPLVRSDRGAGGLAGVGHARDVGLGRRRPRSSRIAVVRTTVVPALLVIVVALVVTIVLDWRFLPRAPSSKGDR